MSHIFISYSRKDIDFAGKIVQALAANNLDTWIDWKSIPKGEDWEQEIYRGIEEADAFLFLISPDSVASQMCNKEIAHAVKNGKRILPIVIRDADLKFIHPDISKRNWIFCRDGRDDFNKAIEETRETIHTDYEWLKYHTELQIKALKWEQKKDNSRLLRGKELREAEQQLTETSNQEDPQPTKLQREYILASRRNEELQRRRITLIVGVGFFIMFGIAIIAGWQWQRAEQQSKIALARQLGIQAQLALIQAANGPSLSTLLGIESLRILPSLEGDQAIREGLDLLPSILTHVQTDCRESLRNIVFDPSGKLIAAECYDHNVYIWNVNSGKEITSVSHYGYGVDLAFSPDGRLLAGGNIHGEVQIWNAYTGEQFALFDASSRVWDVEFSPNGQLLAAGNENGQIYIWNVEKKVEIAKFAHDQVKNNATNKIAFSPDGKLLASASQDNTARVWNISTGTESSRVQHEYWVTHISFSPNGHWVASTDEFQTLKVWNVTTGEVVASWQYNDGFFACGPKAVFSSDGKWVASGGSDGIVRLWDMAKLTEFASYELKRNACVDNISFSDDGKSIAAAGEDFDDTLGKVWNIESGKEIARLYGSMEAHFSPVENVLASSIGNNLYILKVAQTGSDIAHTNTGQTVKYVSFLQEKDRILFGGQKSYTYWNIISGDAVHLFPTLDEDPFSDSRFEAVNSTGEWFVQFEYGALHITNRFALDNAINVSNPHVMVFNPGGTLLATGSTEGIIQIWDTASGAELKKFHLEKDRWPKSLTFSKDSDYLAVGTDTGLNGKNTVAMIYVWNVKTGNEESHYVVGNTTYTLAFNMDGKLLVSGGSDKTGWIWDTATGKVIARIYHDGTINAAVFSPDNAYLATGGDDHKIRIWSIGNWKEISRINFNNSVTALAFSPNGRQIVAGDNGGQVKVFLWKPEDLISIACSRLPRNFSNFEWNQYIGDLLPYQAVCPNLPIEPEITITPTP